MAAEAPRVHASLLHDTSFIVTADSMDEELVLGATPISHPPSVVEGSAGHPAVDNQQPEDPSPPESTHGAAAAALPVAPQPAERADPIEAHRDVVVDVSAPRDGEMGARLDQMDRGTLLAYRAELTLELAWMQQAVASREKVRCAHPCSSSSRAFQRHTHRRVLLPCACVFLWAL